MLPSVTTLLAERQDATCFTAADPSGDRPADRRHMAFVDQQELGRGGDRAALA